VPDGWATTTQKFKDLDAAIAVVRQREEDFTARSMEEKRKESYADAERLRRKRSLDVEEEFLRKEQEMRLSVVSLTLAIIHLAPFEHRLRARFHHLRQLHSPSRCPLVDRVYNYDQIGRCTSLIFQRFTNHSSKRLSIHPREKEKIHIVISPTLSALNIPDIG